MILVAGPRGSGRTEYAVRWLKEDIDKRLLVVAQNNERHRIITEYDLLNESVYTAGYAIEVMRGERRKLALDDLFLMLSSDAGRILINRYAYMIDLITVYADEVVDLNTNTGEALRLAMNEVQEKLDD